VGLYCPISGDGWGYLSGLIQDAKGAKGLAAIGTGVVTDSRAILPLLSRWVCLPGKGSEPAGLRVISHGGIDGADPVKVKGAIGRVLLGQRQVGLQDRGLPLTHLKADIRRSSLDQGIRTWKERRRI